MTSKQTPANLLPLQRGYLDNLKAAFPDFVQLKADLSRGVVLPHDKVAQLSMTIHSLCGLGTTVGFPDITETAHALEVAMKPFVDGRDNKLNTAVVLPALEAFESACDRALIGEAQFASGATPFLAPPVAADREESVCIMAKPGSPAQAISEQLQHFGYRVAYTQDIAAFKEAIISQRPHVTIVYSDLSEPELGQLQQVQKEIKTMASVPQMIIISPRDNFETRLAGVRLGAKGFFNESADIIQIIDKIEQLVSRYVALPSYHVLIVDDDEMHVKFYVHALESAGIIATAVAKPQEALQVISDQAIDLVLMDFIMPHCNGQELATIIRQHEKYVSLPIIFLSARDDIQSLLINTGLGIDDFLVKPVTTEHLVSVVQSRAQRAAELRVLMARDSFTGLLNHAHFMDMLTMEQVHVKRYRTSTAYAIIDIDHFKQVNDTYGHVAGDHVIKSLARVLQQRLRRSDIIGRCGGEEFGIIMPDCDEDNARLIIESMRQQFADLAFHVDQHHIKVTFSAGLTTLAKYDNVDEAIKEADKALYEAKSKGRNRLIVV